MIKLIFYFRPVACSLLVSLFMFSEVNGETVLTDIKSVRKLALGESERNIPVAVEGQVVRINPYVNNFFLHDGTHGIFVRGPVDESYVRVLKVGDVILVEGESKAGGFAPDIQAHTISVLRNEPRLPARDFWEHERSSPATDCDWVNFRCRLISMTVLGNKRSINLEVERNQIITAVQVPYSSENEIQFSEKMFHFGDLLAVAGTVYNDSRQFGGRIFYVNSADDFIVADQHNKFTSKEVKQVHELMRFGQNLRVSAKTVGTVTYAGEREIYLRGEKTSLKVFVKSYQDIQPGDQVIVEGFLSPQPVSPAFRARSVAVTGQSAVPKPVELDLESGINDLWNYDLITVDAELVELGRQFDVAGGQQETLLCRSNGELFEVRYPVEEQRGDDLQVGAMLRLTGICNIIRGMERRWFMDLDGFWLQLRGVDDVVVLETAPWWNTSRLLWSIVILLGVLSSVLIWVVMLRTTVTRQTRIISDKVERETILDERQRIARELHDNMEQGLAGATIQLGGCQRLVELNKEQHLKTLHASMEGCNDEGMLKAFQSLEKEFEVAAAKSNRSLGIVENMITLCSQNSRATILELRGGLLEKMSLVSAVEVSVAPLAEECNAELDLKVEGKPVRLKLAAERHLLLMVKEAVSNSARHSSPSEIAVCMEYSDRALIIKVIDNGCGFEVDGIPKVGHFGVQGMRERIAQLNGTIDIDSQMGKGTSIVVNIPFSKTWLV